MNARLYLLICFVNIAFIFPLHAQITKIYNSQNYTANWQHIKQPSFNLLYTSAFPKNKVQPLIHYIDSLIGSIQQALPLPANLSPSFIIYDNQRAMLESNIIANDYNKINHYPVVMDDVIILHSNSDH